MGTALVVSRQRSIEAEAGRGSRIHRRDRCPRCSGLMVVEWCEDLSDYSGQRCVQCGELVDPVIMQNRRYGTANQHGNKQEGLGMIRHVIGAGAAVLMLIVALSHPGFAAAHGGSDVEQDPCTRLAGENMVHFSAYQPQYELTDQYCTEIPRAGDTFLVVDLVDPTLRTEPVGMRVMKGNGRSEADVQIVADVRPSTHPDGVLRSEVSLEEGLYTVIIASEKQNLLRRPQYLLRVHMIDYQKLALSIAGPLIGVLLVGWLLYKLIRSRWLQRFWSVPIA
jgi:hypothetical protein